MNVKVFQLNKQEQGDKTKISDDILSVILIFARN